MRNHETSSLNSSSSWTTLLLVHFFKVFFQVIFLQNFRNAFIVLKNIFKKFNLREVSYPYSLLIKITLNCNVMQLEMQLEVHLKVKNSKSISNSTSNPTRSYTSPHKMRLTVIMKAESLLF